MDQVKSDGGDIQYTQPMTGLMEDLRRSLVQGIGTME